MQETAIVQMSAEAHSSAGFDDVKADRHEQQRIGALGNRQGGVAKSSYESRFDGILKAASRAVGLAQRARDLGIFKDASRAVGLAQMARDLGSLEDESRAVGLAQMARDLGIFKTESRAVGLAQVARDLENARQKSTRMRPQKSTRMRQ